MTVAESVQAYLETQIPPPLRVEVIDCPGVPPARGVPSVEFSDAEGFEHGFEAVKSQKFGNGEVVQVYLKRRTRQVPNEAGNGFKPVVNYVADFAV